MICRIRKEKTARNIILITAAVIIVAVAAWAIVSSRNQHNDQTSQGIVLDENAEAWDGNMNDLSGGKDGIKIPGYGELTVPKMTAPGILHWQIQRTTIVISDIPLLSMTIRFTNQILLNLAKP